MEKTFLELTVQELIEELLNVNDKTMKVNVWSYGSENSYGSSLTTNIELSIDEDGFNILNA